MADVFIHPTAVVSERAFIGEGTKIWHHTHVREGVSIGKRCILGKGVYVDTNVVIGDACKIQNYACVYQGVTLKDHVFIGPHVVFTNDKYPRSELWGTERLTTTIVEEGASIGANATVVCGIIIGKYAMVGAGTVVTRDVPDHGFVLGNPAVLKGYVCVCGHPLEEKGSKMVCPACNRIQEVSQ
jgi:acetyltransferase-like isoleucine patch superfamily enzyme